MFGEFKLQANDEVFIALQLVHKTLFKRINKLKLLFPNLYQRIFFKIFFTY